MCPGEPMKRLKPQTDFIAVHYPTDRERARDTEHRRIVAWLAAHGVRWHKLPFWRRRGRGIEAAYYMGPPCRRGHMGVRRTADHGCLSCILQLPADPEAAPFTKRKHKPPRRHPRRDRRIRQAA